MAPLKTGTVDLGALVSNTPGDIEISVKPGEHAEERKSRLKRNDWEFWTSQFWTFIVVVILLIISYFLYQLVDDADAKIAEWARTGLSAILAGVVAFFTGLKVGSSK